MITQEQEKLAHELFQSLKAKFPEIELVGLIESPADPDSTWVNIVMPDDEDLEIDLLEFAAEQTTDILLDQDEHFSVMPDLYEVEIAFPSVKGQLIGDRKKRFDHIHQAIGNLIRSQNAGRMGVMSDGIPGPLVMFCHLKNLDIVRREIADLLDRQTVLGEANIHWNHPGSSERTPLYPPSGDGIS